MKTILIACLMHAPNQSGLLLGRGFERRGYIVHYVDYAKSSEGDLLDLVRRIRPDMLFVTKGETIRRSFYDSIDSMGITRVLWYPDAYSPNDLQWGFGWLRDVLPCFDTILVTSRGLVEEFRKFNSNSFFAPHFFDNHYFRINDVSEAEKSLYDADVCFIGNNLLCRNPWKSDILER